MVGATHRTALYAAGFALFMLGAAYASVPLYRLFCQVTGFGGTTQVADASAVVPVLDQTIAVRFDGNVMPGLAWSFHPVKTVETIRIGERRLAFYRATNTSDRPIVGQASFNVSPDTAGKFFMKVACFCFVEQRLEPGQTVDMPVTYYVDPAILADPDGRRIEEITLSYTFYPMDSGPDAGQKPVKTARAGPPAPNQG